MLIKNTRALFAKAVAIFSLLAISFVAAVVLHQEKQFYTDKISVSKGNAEMLANVLSDFVELSLLFTDSFLKKVITQQEYENKHNLDHGFNPLGTATEEIPYMSFMLVTDQHGTIKSIYNNNYSNLGLNIGENFYSYQPDNDSHQDTAAVQPIIGHFTDKHNNHLITVSRSYNDLQGNFAGLLVAAIDSKYLYTFFDSVELGNKTEMVLMLDNKQILFSSPDLLKEIDVIAYIKKEPINISYHGAGNVTKAISKESFIDGYLHIFAFRHFNTIPVSVALITFEGDILKHWFYNSDNITLFLLITIVLGSIMVFAAMAVAKQIEHSQHIEKLAIAARKHKTEMVAKAINEIKLPINAMIGFSDMLNANYFGEINSKQKKRLDDINICGSHVLKMIDYLIKLSEDSSDKIKMLEEDVSIAETLDKVLMMVEQESVAKGVKIIHEQTIYTLPHIKADAFKLIQILLNLIKNMLNLYTGEGAITVNGFIAPDKNLVVELRTSGAVLNKVHMSKSLSLFDQMDKLHDIKSEEIGLALAQKLAELHDAQINFVEAKDESKVSLIIPAKRIINE